ncbi:hypothetical protein ACJX0J_038287 [Zea mays]
MTKTNCMLTHMKNMNIYIIVGRLGKCMAQKYKGNYLEHYIFESTDEHNAKGSANFSFDGVEDAIPLVGGVQCDNLPVAQLLLCGSDLEAQPNLVAYIERGKANIYNYIIRHLTLAIEHIIHYSI